MRFVFSARSRKWLAAALVAPLSGCFATDGLEQRRLVQTHEAISRELVSEVRQPRVVLSVSKTDLVVRAWTEQPCVEKVTPISRRAGLSVKWEDVLPLPVTLIVAGAGTALVGVGLMAAGNAPVQERADGSYGAGVGLGATLLGSTVAVAGGVDLFLMHRWWKEHGEVRGEPVTREAACNAIPASQVTVQLNRGPAFPLSVGARGEGRVEMLAQTSVQVPRPGQPLEVAWPGWRVRAELDRTSADQLEDALAQDASSAIGTALRKEMSARCVEGFDRLSWVTAEQLVSQLAPVRTKCLPHWTPRQRQVLAEAETTVREREREREVAGCNAAVLRVQQLAEAGEFQASGEQFRALSWTCRTAHPELPDVLRDIREKGQASERAAREQASRKREEEDRKRETVEAARRNLELLARQAVDSIQRRNYEAALVPASVAGVKPLLLARGELRGMLESGAGSVTVQVCALKRLTALLYGDAAWPVLEARARGRLAGMDRSRFETALRECP
ncbi:MAG: hypothetical protein RL653_4473 [Pseudomonadota bacterium]|jgi:hypothetical protein